MLKKRNRISKSPKQKKNNSKKKERKINKKHKIQKKKIQKMTMKILIMKRNYMILMEDIYLMIHFMNIGNQKEEEFLSIILQEIHIKICLRMNDFGDMKQ